MNYRYEDVGRTGRRPQPDWVTRGWRRRYELEPGQKLMRPEAEIERLSAELGALKAAVLYASVHVKPLDWRGDKAEDALTELFALVPGVVVLGSG